MPTRPFHPLRRRLLQLAPLVFVPRAVLAQGQKKRVDPGEPAAQGLGYTHDAAEVDKAKYPKYEQGQACGNCTYFRAKAEQPWGPCDIFGGREVSTKGWCSAWMKKPGAG